MMDTSELVVTAIVAALGAVLLVIALRWRRMIAEGPGLPLWRFLRREGITRDDAADAVSAKAVKQAELACSVCGSRQECRGQLLTGKTAVPPANCPNRRLFREFGLWAGRQRE
jgi:hypothetical protein